MSRTTHQPRSLVPGKMSIILKEMFPHSIFEVFILPWCRRMTRWTSPEDITSFSTWMRLRMRRQSSGSAALTDASPVLLFFYLWRVQTVRCGSRDRRCRWCRCFPARPSQPACCRSEVERNTCVSAQVHSSDGRQSLRITFSTLSSTDSSVCSRFLCSILVNSMWMGFIGPV